MTQFGTPLFIMSDNDAKFTSAPVKEFAKNNNIKWKFTSAYNPRGNAKVERMVGTLKRAMNKIVLSSNKQREECIDDVLGGYRR